MKKLLFIIAVLFLTACNTYDKYTRLTPKMRKNDGQYCPTYQNTKPVKREIWKRYARYQKPTESGLFTWL